MPQQSMGMGMRPQGMPMPGQQPGMPMSSNGPNGQQGMVNRTVSGPGGQLTNNHSISDSSMGPGGLVSMAPMTSMPGEMQGTVVSSMGPQGMQGMRPGMMQMQQMNGPNTMVRTVGQSMQGMGGMQLRQGVPGQMMAGQRMLTPGGVRMPGVGVNRNVSKKLK